MRLHRAARRASAELWAAPLLVVVGLGCSGAPEPAASAPGQGRTAPASSATAESNPPDARVPASAGSSGAAVGEWMRRVSRLRGLEQKSDVKAIGLSRAEMAARVRAQIESDVPESVVAGSSEILVALSLVPRDFDYIRSITQLMSVELAGFYDPKADTLYVADDLWSDQADATLVHELVHALQDQHFDLGSLVDYRPDAGDAQAAVHCLAEGDATSAMMDDLVAGEGMRAIDLPDDVMSVQVRGSIELSMQTQDVPGVLKRSIVAPYIDGLTFVHQLRREGGWAAVDAAWRSPPSTTEQLLHFEKWASREPAVDVAVPVAPPNGPTDVIYRDVLGEQTVRLVLEEWVPRRVAVEAASDWGGDRVAVFRDDTRAAVAWHVQYDTAASARRGFEAFARGVLRTAGPDEPEEAVREGARRATRRGEVCVSGHGVEPLAITLHDRGVALVAGPYRRDSGERGTTSCPAALKWAANVARQPEK